MQPQQKRQNLRQKQDENEYILRTEELPETQQPSPDNIVKFFKVKTRTNEHFYNVQIGLLVVSYQHYQQDFLTFLSNLLMCQAQFLNVRIVQPNHLYISMNAALTIGPIGNDYLQLQSDIYYLLQFCRQTILKFLKSHISEQAIFQSDTNSEQILKKFEELCIKPIKQKHQSIFNRENQ